MDCIKHKNVGGRRTTHLRSSYIPRLLIRKQETTSVIPYCLTNFQLIHDSLSTLHQRCELQSERHTLQGRCYFRGGNKRYNLARSKLDSAEYLLIDQSSIKLRKMNEQVLTEIATEGR